MKHPIDAEEADFIEGFYCQLPMVAYASMPAVSPLLAARLLCAQKPMYDGTHDNEEAKILAPVFEDIAEFAPAPRSMRDWVQIAQTKELAHSEDIAAYFEFRAQENAAGMEASQQSQGAHSSPEAATGTSAADAFTATAVTPRVAMSPLMSAQKSSEQEAERARGEIQNWVVQKPQRFSPYITPLYRLLLAEWQSGRLRRPTARDVLDAWSESKPPEIFAVMQDGLKYFKNSGDVNTLSLAALSGAIARMTPRRD